MTFLDRLERHLGRFAIPGLIRYIVALNALVFVLLYVAPGYESMLVLDRNLILQGQVWRIITWLFIPGVPSDWAILYLIAMWWLWWIGSLLESSWGTFRFNAYYFLGVFLCILSAFIFGASGGNVFLNLSIFFALATIIPNMEILLFFVIPLKIKWLALFSVVTIVLPALIFGQFAAKMIVLMCLGNYILFFGPALIRQRREQRTIQVRRARYEDAKDKSPYLHSCEVCGITEISDPHADFRVAGDGREYCTKHLPSTVPVQPD